MASVEAYRAVMRSQLGVSENPPGSNQVLYSAWYGVAAPWCQMFQNWAHVKLGMVPPGFVAGVVPKGSAFTPTCADWFRKQGRWFTRPQVGDLVYYDFPDDGVNRISHVGWVEEVPGDGSIVAIEGNTDEAGGRTGGKVMRKIRRVGIVGYGRPNYQQEEDDMPTMAELAKELENPDSPLHLAFVKIGRRSVNSTLGSAREDDKGTPIPFDTERAGAGSPARVGVLELTSRAVEGVTGGTVTADQLEELKRSLVAALPGYTIRIEPESSP